MKKLQHFLSAVICLTILVSCDSSNKGENSTKSVDESETTQVISNEDKTIVEEEVQTNPSNASEQYDNLVGTWLFIKATAGENDATTKYPFGYLNGETKKMTLQADGTIKYEKDVVDLMKMEKATWKIEKHETNDFFYFVTIIIADGVTETSREKILSSTNKQFIFGKRFTVEYAASK